MKFPFEPNEKTKVAFRQQDALRATVMCVIDSLLESATRSIQSPWKILHQEHPEIDIKKTLRYNHITETIDLKIEDEKKE